ncbi:PilZ domain-containing protein [Desulfobacterales bacterium HSG16]|nr:PilZ domain-containing protein [Desulfobacterales bacterium HSG16]
MKDIKVFMALDNSVTYICPKCGVAESSNATQYKEIETAVRIKHVCKKCGHRYGVILERRQFYRKQTDLPGVYYTNESTRENTGGQPVLIKDLSRNGVKFELQSDWTFDVDDRVFLEFELENNPGLIVRKEIMVKMILGHMVGAEFTTPLDLAPSYMI